MTPTPDSLNLINVDLELHHQSSLSNDDLASLLRAISVSSTLLSTEASAYDEVVPEKFDILCGKDKMAYRHVGNQRFRHVINMNRERYQNAKKKKEKTRITDEIVQNIRECQPGGRFLKMDPKTNMWYDVGDESAHEKVSHALRSAKYPSNTARREARKKKKAKQQAPTNEERQAFWTLYAKQQIIYAELLGRQQL